MQWSTGDFRFKELNQPFSFNACQYFFENSFQGPTDAIYIRGPSLQYNDANTTDINRLAARTPRPFAWGSQLSRQACNIYKKTFCVHPITPPARREIGSDFFSFDLSHIQLKFWNHLHLIGCIWFFWGVWNYWKGGLNGQWYQIVEKINVNCCNTCKKTIFGELMYI